MKNMRMGLMLAAALIAGTAMANRIVVRTGHAVSPKWELPEFMGKDFFMLLNWYGFASYGDAAPAGYDVYRECGIVALTHPAKRPIPFTGRYTLEDFVANDRPERREMVLGTNMLHRPLHIYAKGTRPVWLLDAEYPGADRAGFEEWKKVHTNYWGYSALGEFDSQSFHYGKRLKKADAAETRRLLDSYLGLYEDYARDIYFKNQWVKEAARRSREYFFGSPNGVPVSYWQPGMAYQLSAAGMKAAGFEATAAATHGSWTLGAAYTRGAARVYGLPIFWYTANCYTGFRKGAEKHQGGENRTRSGRQAGPTEEWWGPENGLSPSLIAFQNMYGWLMGAQALSVENYHQYHAKPDKNGVLEPTVHAWHLNELHKLSKRVDRGIAYTPMAVLFPVNERLTIEAYPEFERYMEYSRSAAVLTLVPARNERKQGIQGNLYNSEFGDIWDIVCPDATATDQMLSALRGYKAAVMFGSYRRRSPKWALGEWVRGGGTLFLACDHVREGYIAPEMAGVSFPRRKVRSAGEWLVDDRGERRPLKAPYVLEEGVPSTAKVLWTDENGVPVAYVNDFARGRVITVCAAGMMPYGCELPRNIENERHALAEINRIRNGELTCEIMRAVFARIQEETLPVKVTGDIQFGLNRTKKGWLVWLYNNKGMTRFIGSPEELDETKTAQVSIGLKGMKHAGVFDAETGEALTGDGAVTVAVRPGKWRLIEIRTN